jgi:predicted nucleic acid-binding protein
MLSLAARRMAFSVFTLALIPLEVEEKITECRDPKDDKFLELALSGKADVIVTGDQDPLSMHPWRGIAILSPADFLALKK